MRLPDKVAIITGAGNGMGAAHARRFATEGAFVVLTDVEPAAGRLLPTSWATGPDSSVMTSPTRTIGNASSMPPVTRSADWTLS